MGAGLCYSALKVEQAHPPVPALCIRPNLLIHLLFKVEIPDNLPGTRKRRQKEPDIIPFRWVLFPLPVSPSKGTTKEQPQLMALGSYLQIRCQHFEDVEMSDVLRWWVTCIASARASGTSSAAILRRLIINRVTVIVVLHQIKLCACKGSKETRSANQVIKGAATPTRRQGRSNLTVIRHHQ
jgi:hypothetical protein